MDKFKLYKTVTAEIGPVVFRHVFLFVNAVIFGVVILLFVFGERQAALFIGAIIIFNILLGIIQDTRALIALETLQMITALRIIRLNKDGSETTVLIEEIIKGDHIKLKLGDQAPCDGQMISSSNLEVSEALITGESDSFPRRDGEKINAGDIITAGSGIMEAQNIFHESRISKMTEGVKKYSANPSPIQSATNTVIKYSGYILALVIVFTVIRGYIIHDSNIKIVLNIGALASAIVPQGLVVITTLLFALGASSYSKKHVLFQEINATEKLGRIKNLCMDKTGTLTDNVLIVEEMMIPEGVSKEEASALTSAYITESEDSSQIIAAIKRHIGYEEKKREILESLPFSSWRQYGAIRMNSNQGSEIIFVGAPDVFLPYVSSVAQRDWLRRLIDANSRKGKRLLCVARSKADVLPIKISEANLSIVAVFLFQSGFRQGVQKAIKFFQDRGVRIRIISGDNPDTVQSIAVLAGVNHTESVITGREMERWEDSYFKNNVSKYTIFARILPEQKVKIIEAFKKDGFTAMVGDGANDAFAIKKADLGIAMFDGAQATRRLASVVLMNNSFSDLPGGVELADNFIKNIEIFAGIFINQSIIGLLFFIIISIFGYSFPIMPLNITLINYFTVGLPGILITYWAIRPSGKIPPANSESFLSRVIPFAVWCGVVSAIAASVVFALSPEYLKNSQSNTLVALAFIVCGFVFFSLAPGVYRGMIATKKRLHLVILGAIEIILLFLVLKIPLAVHFFSVTTPYPPLYALRQSLLVLSLCGLVLSAIAKWFFRGKKAV
ncbi:MAG: HAD-IC family P-type ATPase [Patescibacteria group bacterium]|nr:HAD-IC family P-type ATPase [Patescibacteria group bacterium]MDE1988257.1 HAD-IC family P-type ATPase [Patescibacteria group bacterium]MDE2218294.1 HAD-IC family P-type ATPase [Patescibacteria group bacterium]